MHTSFIYVGIPDCGILGEISCLKLTPPI